MACAPVMTQPVMPLAASGVTGWIITSAQAISDNGYVVAQGYAAVGGTYQQRDVLLRTTAFDVATVPEPGTWALLGTGLLGVAGVARRRRPVA